MLTLADEMIFTLGRSDSNNCSELLVYNLMFTINIIKHFNKLLYIAIILQCRDSEVLSLHVRMDQMVEHVASCLQVVSSAPDR